jgi:glycosyltransferase involved in cell wall biosynthesis
VLRVQPVLRPAVVYRPLSDDTISVAGTTVVVPAYNPGEAIVRTVQEILSAFDAAGHDVSVLVVSDGSTDGSDALVEAIKSPQVHHLRHDVNKGKGAALRTGFSAARTPVVGFVDADGDLSPRQLVELVRIQNETQSHIVFGSKRHDRSSIDASPLRRLSSRAYQLLVRYLFQLDIKDTQTGIKVFRRDVLDATLPVVREEGYALDLELFVAARSAGFGSFVEVPITLQRIGASTISSRSALRMIAHTLRIFWRAKVTLVYLRAAAPDGVAGGES